MRRPSAALCTTFALALAAAGCGATPAEEAPEFEGEQAAVAEVVEDLQTAAQEDEARRVCTQILARELAQRAGDDCPAAMQQAFDETDTIELTVQSVTVEGDEARAEIYAGTADDERQTVRFVRQGGAWRIAEFGPFSEQ